ncbi:hypothetical protein [Candidatus Poriferisodalis sp.]|uniref:hypothetical protein n=1 Tax=Candidatus Poriferisodalis sp. TaxID=3101277 RepID=UPI003B0161EB
MQNLVGQVIYAGGNAVARITAQDGDKLTISPVGEPVQGETPMPAPGGWKTIEDFNTCVGMGIEGPATGRVLTVTKDGVSKQYRQVFGGPFDGTKKVPDVEHRQVFGGPFDSTKKAPADVDHCGEYTLSYYEGGPREALVLSMPVEFFFEKG